MIRAVARKKNGRTLLVLGVDDVNVKHLTSNEPIHVEGAPLGIDVDVLIMHGTTLRDVIRQLKDAGVELPEIPRVGGLSAKENK